MFDVNGVLNNMLRMIMDNVNEFAREDMTLPNLGTYVTKLKLTGVPAITLSCPTKMSEVNGQQQLETCVRVENIGVSGHLQPASCMPRRQVNIAVKPFEFSLKLAIFPKKGSKSTKNLKRAFLPNKPVKGMQILGLDTMVYKEWGGFKITGPGYGRFMNITAKMPILKTEIKLILLRQLRPILRTFLYTKARLSFL